MGTASTSRAWDPKEVAQAIRPLRALVLGPADHFPNSLFIACPVHYHKLLCKTLGDPAVFQPCKNGTRTLRTNTRICRSTTGRFSGTKDCRMPGSCRKDPNNSVRRDRSLPTPSVGTLRQAHSWLQHCIPSCRLCFRRVPR